MLTRLKTLKLPAIQEEDSQILVTETDRIHENEVHPQVVGPHEEGSNEMHQLRKILSEEDESESLTDKFERQSAEKMINDVSLLEDEEKGNAMKLESLSEESQSISDRNVENVLDQIFH